MSLTVLPSSEPASMTVLTLGMIKLITFTPELVSRPAATIAFPMIFLSFIMTTFHNISPLTMYTLLTAITCSHD